MTVILLRGLKVKKRSEKQYLRLCSLTDSLVKKSSIIIFSKKWRYDIPNFETAFTEFANGLAGTQKLIVVTDFPELNANPVRVSKGVTLNSNYKFVQEVTGIPLFVKDIRNITIADLTCGIPIYINDSVSYYDGGHLNINGIKYYEHNTGVNMKRAIE
jgi:hypothetical protein